MTVFNLDEYYPMEPESQYSYSRYMRRSLFGGINIDPANCHIPLAIYGRNAEIESRCANYERAIHDAGGIDLQLLGIGRNGHIGFNEPGSDKESRTRRVELALSTREAAINEFGSLEQVPQEAVTMGIGTILECKRAILLATGKAKAEAILAALAGPESSGCPASFLQSHDTTYHLDPAAASELPPEILVQASYHNAIGGGPSVRTVALPGPS